MRRVIAAVGLLGTMAAGLAWSQVAPAPPVYAQSGAVIEGRVTNGVTGEAVSGVDVRVLDRQGYVHHTATDSSGSYRITRLKADDDTLEFYKDGFSLFRSTKVLVSGDAPARVDAQLQPWGSLRGRVVDEDGKPASGVRVEAPWNASTVTDDHGEFAFRAVRPGAFILAAKPAAKIRKRGSVRLGTVATYYPSVTEMDQAGRITVDSGENVSGIEIRLKSVPVHRVAGVVRGVDGKPAAHATVKLMGRGSMAQQILTATMIVAPMHGVPSVTVGPGPEPEVARVESKDDGTFEFLAIEPGEWRLTAEVGAIGDMASSGVTPVSVSKKDVEDIRIRLAAPFPADVTVDGAAVQFPVIFTPVEGQPLVSGLPDMVYPGRYRVIPASVEGGHLYLAAVMWGGRDVKGQVVELAPKAGPFKAIYKFGTGEVRGTVEQGEGAIVMLISHEAGDISVIRTLICRSEGSFNSGEIPPGEYFIVAFDHADRSFIAWDELLEAITPIATKVRVEEDSTARVNLRINRWTWN